MPPRCYLALPADAERLTVTGGEAHHLANVLRMKPGDRVEVFDGAGEVAETVVTEIGRRRVELLIRARWTTTEPQGPRIVLATAVPKGDRFRWLVEKATELGVDRLVPLVTERSVVAPGGGKLDKLRQTVIAACKQCGRNRLLEMDEPTAWRDVIAAAERGALVVAHPGGGAWTDVLSDLRQQPRDGTCVLAIGPEGGFTDDEIEFARAADARLVSLGENLLRIETAAIALAAAAVLGLRATAEHGSNGD